MAFSFVFFSCSIIARTWLFFATSKQSRPVMSFMSGSAPNRISVLMHSLSPFWAAMCSGVAKLKSVQFTFAPAFSSTTSDLSTWSVEPSCGLALMTTQCMGVKPPFTSVAFTLAPLAIRDFMTSSRACVAAWCSTDIWFLSVELTSIPVSTSASTASTSPRSAASNSCF